MSPFQPFIFASTPDVHFGPGKLKMLPSLVLGMGKKVLLVTGGSSFLGSIHWSELEEKFLSQKIQYFIHRVDREPSPSMIDACVQKYKEEGIEVVLAIGGGSVLDAGKAISAMLPSGDAVHFYLEGVGTKQHSGQKIPFIAVPTTAGTGSEATKNAVLSEIGEEGYKKSLRHPNFVPTIALVDPTLMLACPSSITASSGMDAFTQLLESYLSTTAQPMTDALALEGLKQVATSLLPAYQEGNQALAPRSGMALASLLSGITLANAGLGLVHGFASSIGGFFDIPHGVICSRLMFSCNLLIVRKLRQESSSSDALAKYAQVGRLFHSSQDKSSNFYIDFLVDTIAQWSEEMKIPALSDFGVRALDIPRIVQASGNKNNPISLSKEEMAEALEMAL
jgi:alcohol dehydrogenase class IV